MKILLIRFSSIGDIVLTTPVVRCIKEQLGAEIHYITKQNFVSLLSPNPYIDKVIGIDKETNPLSSKITFLREQEYDYIIDLHKNWRSLYLKIFLKKKSYTFSKLSFRKWLLTQFKINVMPPIHIVERYLNTTKSLGVINDNKGLDFFIAPHDFLACEEVNPALKKNNYICFVIGAAHATKRLPKAQIIKICGAIKEPIVLIGGKEEATIGAEIAKTAPHIIDFCGKFNLGKSAAIVAQSRLVIAHDTGFMHIAAALKKKVISIWGSTVPDFGMYPYLPADAPSFVAIENKNLSCRPCHKIGKKKCPKAHFDCMNALNIQEIIKATNI